MYYKKDSFSVRRVIVMFELKYKTTGTIYKIFGVNKIENAVVVDTDFLIYKDGQWTWVPSYCFEPIK